MEPLELHDGRHVSERFAQLAVEVRQGPSHDLLVNQGNVPALREDRPENAMVVLHMGLFAGGIGMAVEDPCPTLSDEGACLQAVRIGELGPVVGEDDGKEPSEGLRPPETFEAVEDIDDRLRGVPLPDEGQHEGAGVELQREKHVSSAPSLHAVHLHKAHGGILFPEEAELLIAPAQAAFLIHLVDGSLALPGPQLRGHGQQPAPCAGQDRLVHIVADGSRAAVELIRLDVGDAVQVPHTCL